MASIFWTKKYFFLVFIYIFLNIHAYGQLDSTANLQLTEFVFALKSTIKISADTISYTVDSFSQNQNATTDEVIKKLPGVEVSDGKILVQGKEVRKVFLNGKEYNSADITSLTQNLPADVLDKIEFADWVDEGAQFTGIITEREDKVMQLRFKKHYSEGITGRASGGYGSKERYQGSLFGNYMGTAFRLTSTGNINNTGVGSGSSANGGNDASAARGNNSPGITEKKNIALNFSYEPSSAFTLNGAYEAGGNNNFLESSLQKVNFLPGDSLLYNNTLSAQQSNSLNHKIHLKSLYRFNKNTQLRSAVAVSWNQSEKDNRSTDITFFDESDQEYLLKRLKEQHDRSASPSVSFNNSFQKRFSKKGRSLSASANIRYGVTEADGETVSINQFADVSQNQDLFFESASDVRNSNTSLNVQYTEPVSESSMFIGSYTASWVNEHSDREVFADKNGTSFYDTIQSRSFTNLNKEQRGGVFYQFQHNKLNAKAGAEVQYFSRQSERRNFENNMIGQKGINYFPSLNSSYKFSKNRKISFDYRGTIQSPSVTQLQPMPDYTDSLNIYTGNPGLLPELRNNLQLSFNDINPKNKNILWLRLRYGFVRQQIINKTEITASTRLTTPVNTDGGFNTGASSGCSFQLVPKILRVNTGFNFDISRNISFINNRFFALVNYNAAPDIRLQISSLKWYEGSVHYSYRYGSVRNAAAADRVIQTHNLTHEGSFSLPYHFRVSYFLNYIFNSGFSKEYSQNFTVLNFSLDKALTRSQKLYMRLQGFDVLNQYPTLQRVVGDNFLEDRMYNRLGSYFMLSVNYRFSYFPARE